MIHKTKTLLENFLFHEKICLCSWCDSDSVGMGRANDSLRQAELKALSLSKKMSRKDCRKDEAKKGGGLGNVYGQTWPSRPGLVKWEGGQKEICQRALKEEDL